MGDATPVNPQVFQPYDGGRGKRLTATTSSSSVGIPGISEDNPRMLVTNGGSVSAFIIFGGSSPVATTDCMEILPGTTQVFTAPFTSPNGLSVAAITASGSTTISVVAGKGV